MPTTCLVVIVLLGLSRWCSAKLPDNYTRAAYIRAHTAAHKPTVIATHMYAAAGVSMPSMELCTVSDIERLRLFVRSYCASMSVYACEYVPSLCSSFSFRTVVLVDPSDVYPFANI